MFACIAEVHPVNSGQSTKSRILEAFGVNPYIAGGVTGINKAQAVTAEASFCTNCINPLLTSLGEAFTARVAPRFATGGERLVVWFDP